MTLLLHPSLQGWLIVIQAEATSMIVLLTASPRYERSFIESATTGANKLILDLHIKKPGN